MSIPNAKSYWSRFCEWMDWLVYNHFGKAVLVPTLLIILPMLLSAFGLTAVWLIVPTLLGVSLFVVIAIFGGKYA